MSGVEATELYALKWSNHNNFLTQRLYEQCRVSAVSGVYLASYTCCSERNRRSGDRKCYQFTI